MITRIDFDAVAESDIQALLQVQAPESMTLDYKQSLYGNSDSDKKEFLKDLTALANTNGGHLILGIRETDGVAESVTPISAENPDAELLRMESIARSGVEPPLPGLRIKSISLEAGGYLIVCRVPKSWIGPHRVVAKGSNRFYMRNSAGVFEPSIEELRALFTQRNSFLHQAQAFRDKRLSEICDSDGIRPLVGNGRLVIHVLPSASFSGMINLDLEAVHNANLKFRPMGSSGMSPRFNYHGFITERGGEENHGYVQIFRNGCLEATKAPIVREHEGKRNIPGTGVEELVFKHVPDYVSGLDQLGIPGPYLILITFEGVSGAKYAVSQDDWDYEDSPLTYDVMKLPEGLLESQFSERAVHQAMKPAFDALWNAIGYSSSQNFGEDGMWRNRGRR